MCLPSTVGASSSHDDAHSNPGMENDLSRILDDLPALVWTALPDGDVDFVNQRWCDYTGLTLDAARALGWQTTIHPVPFIGPNSRSAGDPVRLRVSQSKRKCYCGASMEDIAGSSSVVARWQARLHRFSSGASWPRIITTNEVRK